jgi:hypothetical protein
MTTMDTVIASLPGAQLSLGGLLNRLHRQGRLGPLVREILAEQLVQEQARQAGLSVTAEELQTAADAYRRSAGLNTAADTHAWLVWHGLSSTDFEAALEETLLAAKLRQQQSADKIEAYFSAHQADYERLWLGLLVAERDDLARELASQVSDDGRDLDEVAQENGLAVVRRQLLRKDLGGALAEALATAKVGDVVGPVAMPQGFALAQIKERHEPVLDSETRQAIQHELFNRWLVRVTQEAVIDLSVVGTAG